MVREAAQKREKAFKDFFVMFCWRKNLKQKFLFSFCRTEDDEMKASAVCAKTSSTESKKLHIFIFLAGRESYLNTDI